MTNNKVGELENRNAILEQKAIELESKNFREQVLSDLYSKQFNLIVFGIPEREKWEPRSKSLHLVKSFIKVNLKIDQEVTILDAHRLWNGKSQNQLVIALTL